jgi:hypothetical protein
MCRRLPIAMESPSTDCCWTGDSGGGNDHDNVDLHTPKHQRVWKTGNSHVAIRLGQFRQRLHVGNDPVGSTDLYRGYACQAAFSCSMVVFPSEITKRVL